MKDGYVNTSVVPQSQISSSSTMPFPHTGSPTVDVGSLIKHRPVFRVLKPLCRSLRLQLLHTVWGGKVDTADMMHVPVGSLHVQGPVYITYQM